MPQHARKLPRGASHTPAAPARATDPARLFATLNGRSVAASGQCWRIDVFSISHHAGHRWVQLALSGPTDYFLTVRLAAGDGADRVVPVLLSWLNHPSGNGEILKVA